MKLSLVVLVVFISVTASAQSRQEAATQEATAQTEALLRNAKLFEQAQ